MFSKSATYTPVTRQSRVDADVDASANIDALPISSVLKTRHEELIKKRQQLSSIPSIITDSTDVAARER